MHLLSLKTAVSESVWRLQPIAFMASWRTGELRFEGSSVPHLPRFGLHWCTDVSLICALAMFKTYFNCRYMTQILYETKNYNGISEILDILARYLDLCLPRHQDTRYLAASYSEPNPHFCWCSIVNGFAVPIKKEHKQMLQKYLIPLHKVLSLCCCAPGLAFNLTSPLTRVASFRTCACTTLPSYHIAWPFFVAKTTR